MKKITATVIVDQKEVTEADLRRWRSDAIENWHKAEKTIVRAESRRRESEEIVESCNARLRLLRLLSNR